MPELAEVRMSSRASLSTATPALPPQVVDHLLQSSEVFRREPVALGEREHQRHGLAIGEFACDVAHPGVHDILARDSRRIHARVAGLVAADVALGFKPAKKS